MLLRLFRRLASRTPSDTTLQDLIDKAVTLRQAGDLTGAIRAFREVLEKSPDNLNVLNDLGACLAHVGRLPEAQAVFELAYSLDDTFITAIANHAKVLADQRRGAEAMQYLRRAKLAAPEFTQPDSVYAVLCLMNGEVERASRFQLRAWLGDFDNLRNANGYLFWCGYGDAPEDRIASEHKFWAQTLAPLPSGNSAEANTASSGNSPGGISPRIRIGYWSPDFRAHSVRYFFRPLLQNHDRSRFEVFLYHDAPVKDDQTALISAAAEHFRDVSEVSDAALIDLIRSDGLDVLVDLAGHTSYNRLSLLQARLARLQVNALGYPPTTGLSTIDAKVVDPQAVGPRPDLHYTEEPMVLPGSFWCFDPMEETPEPSPPPVLTHGYVTFGCAGNIAKITPQMLQAWKAILEALPTSKLVIRSINFLDEDALRAMQERLVGAGLPTQRITLHRPLGGSALWESYAELDIVLDTFPFNGGTTTCFATYMGVPVVSLYGESLISRMGLSVLTALGAPELAVDSFEAYVERATALARDVPSMERFRREARSRYHGSGLGNGALFAREFEQACESFLDRSVVSPYRNNVPALPADEIMRRAYAVARNGNAGAAQRIVDCCLRLYPQTPAAHLLQAQQLALQGDAQSAIHHLLQKASELAEDQRAPLLILALRLTLLEEDTQAARSLLEQLQSLTITDELDRVQVRLYEAALTEARPADLDGAVERSQNLRVLILIPCDDGNRFDRMRDEIAGTCNLPTGSTLDVEACSESRRIPAYEAALGSGKYGIVVLLQKNVEIHNRDFLDEVQRALQKADVVSFAGARRWARVDWRADHYRQKVGCFLAESREKSGFVDLHVFAQQQGADVCDLAVLDGSVLAVKTSATTVDFDEELLGADTLLEEDWTARMAEAGARLAVNRRLAVLVDSKIALDGSNRTDARVRCAEERGLDPFAVDNGDELAISVPSPTIANAVRIALSFFC